MSKTLELLFKNAAGGNRSLPIKHPKDDLTPTEVEAAMDQVIAADSFSKDGDAVYATKRGARYVERTVTEVFAAE